MDKNNSDTLHSSKHDLKRKHDESDKKSKKRKKKHKRRKESTSSSDLGERKKVKKHKKKKDKKSKTSKNVSTSEEIVADVPLELMSKSKAMAPMTKEEWDKRQSIIRRVYDEESGRNRLIKGDGEVIEEIVSLKRHKEINKTATQGDGAYFQSKIIAKLN